MTKFLTTLTLVASLFVSIASSASAQTTTPPAGDRTGTVFGQIANGTKGGKVPGDLVMMLHAWDENGETVMLDGKADASGAFRFETAPMKDGWMFAAMLSYNDVTFFSDGVEVQPGAKEIPLALAIYETSSDASLVWVSQYHTLLDFAPGEVIVNEIYILSNPTDRVIVGGLRLAGGSTATLQFALPAGANKVRFEGDDPGTRFILTPDGFADTAAVLPGEEMAQVMLTYTLPYSSGMTISHAINYPVEATNVMLRADSGVTLTGKGLGEATRKEVAPGAVFDIHTGNPLAPGDSLTVTLTGEPTYSAANGMSGAMAESVEPVATTIANRWGIPAAGALLGLAMIGFGIWWWRRPSERMDEVAEHAAWPITAQSVLDAIATLDEAYERGEVSDEDDYRSRRAELRAQARAILQARQSVQP
jgi:hypothetical protein